MQAKNNTACIPSRIVVCHAVIKKCETKEFKNKSLLYKRNLKREDKLWQFDQLYYNSNNNALTRLIKLPLCFSYLLLVSSRDCGPAEVFKYSFALVDIAVLDPFSQSCCGERWMIW